MLIFGSVCLTEHEAWIEDRKYVHSSGVLYAVRNREADEDYVAGEKWLLKHWRGGKCKSKEDQRLFAETVGEMVKIVQKVVPTGPRRQKRRPSTATVATVLVDAATCVSDSSDEVQQKPQFSLAKAIQLMPSTSLLRTMMNISAISTISTISTTSATQQN
jgi:hypothetical protein